MRKSTINHISATSLWLALCALPLIILCVLGVHHTSAEMSAWVQEYTGCMSSVPMYDIVNQTIGPNGYLPLIPSELMFFVDYATYVTCVVFARFVLTLLYFLPNCIADMVQRAREKVRL